MKALALVEAPGHVCCRYRIRAFERALAERDIELTIAGLARAPLARWRQIRGAAAYDVVILQRKLLGYLDLRLLRQSAARLVFDFDDAVLYRDSNDARGPHSARRTARFSRVVRLADAVIAGNDFLADCALRAGAVPERVGVIPTCIDPSLYKTAGDLENRRDSELNLAWIGSSSTLKALEERRDLWDRVGREVPGVRLRVICDRFPNLGALRVVPIPWSGPFEAEDLAASDVGVAWMPDDLWSRGKCGLKVLQYQAAGLPTVANPVGIHQELVTHGVHGYLPDGDDAWVESIRTLAAERGLRGLMGRAARRHLEEHFSVEAWSDAFAATVAPGRAAAASRPHASRSAGSIKKSSSA